MISVASEELLDSFGCGDSIALTPSIKNISSRSSICLLFYGGKFWYIVLEGYEYELFLTIFSNGVIVSQFSIIGVRNLDGPLFSYSFVTKKRSNAWIPIRSFLRPL